MSCRKTPIQKFIQSNQVLSVLLNSGLLGVLSVQVCEQSFLVIFWEIS